MPAKRKSNHTHRKHLTPLKRFKKNHKTLHTLFVLAAIVVIWRGIWGVLDTYFFPGNPILSYGISAVIALLVLFLDDFSLKELDR